MVNRVVLFTTSNWSRRTVKALKKILSTGNGKCNIGNKYDISYKSDNELVRNILQEYNYDVQNYFLNSSFNFF
jgi:predicted flavoprotein YhiN